ncbi:GH25 family lysozyme [Anaerosinus massiliensis]|uniref:GH25 family lysozyme n=1 Tax=Massilibacillus massiliensis TaxID=1806837 RepID=UPI000DA63CF3|nr:GH25 family lysozyme [Massilibacillus massiliensis]
MKLIDISAWQDHVDWNAVCKEGIKGVIVKLGEAGNLDKKFIEHVRNAAAHRLKYGVYFYAHAQSIDEAVKEAEWVDTQIKKHLDGKNPELGIWYDAEEKKMLKGDVTASCSAFVSTLNAIGYVYVGIYSSYSWFKDVINMDQLADYVPYWVAQYNYCNDLILEKPNKRIRIWQFTDHYSDDLPYDGDIYYE